MIGDGKDVFQSTRPVWGATSARELDELIQAKFQSTRPVWGATSGDLAVHKHKLISIHAPRVGRDRSAVSGENDSDNFNPRAPCGARPTIRALLTPTSKFQSTRPVWGATSARELDELIQAKFQSTRPVWGATSGDLAVHKHKLISIHAPRVGRDRSAVSGENDSDNFNPRAPCGARPTIRALLTPTSKFQSTRPVWGATIANF